MSDEIALLIEQNRQTHALLADQRKEMSEIRQDLKAHYKADEKIARLVERHSLYFSIAGLGLPLGLSWLAVKLGLKTNP